MKPRPPKRRVLLLALLMILAVQAAPSPAGAAFFGDVGEIAFDQWTGTPDGIVNHDVFTINANGSELTDVTDAAFSQWHPKWSPDGRKLAYLSVSGLIIRDHATGNLSLVARHRGRTSGGELHVAIEELSWSPDGTRLVFSWTQSQGRWPEEPTAEGDHSAIMIVNADGSGLRTLVPSAKINRSPAWSPDGRWIAFDRYAPNFQYSTDADIWVIRPSGRDLERIAKESWNRDPQWTPDGKIIFVGSRDCPPLWYACDEVFEMTRMGTQVKKLIAYPTDWGEDLEPDWIQSAAASPDSSYLVVLLQPYERNWQPEVDAPDQLWLYELATGETAMLAENDIWMRHMDWRPVCTVQGTPRDDVLKGTSGRDLICGLGGDDRIQGLGGNDVIFGHAGDDVIAGGEGRDIVVGNSGRDRCDTDRRDYSHVC